MWISPGISPKALPWSNECQVGNFQRIVIGSGFQTLYSAWNASCGLGGFHTPYAVLQQLLIQIKAFLKGHTPKKTLVDSGVYSDRKPRLTDASRKDLLLGYRSPLDRIFFAVLCLNLLVLEDLCRFRPAGAVWMLE
jgi:hypothetical protein